MIGSLIAGAVIVTLDEILDLPHLLLGAPPSPINWKEIVAELPLIAILAGLALWLAQLFEERQRRAGQLKALTETGLAIGSTLSLDEVLELALERLGQVIPYDTASLWLREGEVMRVCGARGFEAPEEHIGLTIPISDDPLSQEILRTKQSLALSDAQRDGRFRGLAGTGWVRSWMGVPLLSKGEVIALFTLNKKEPDVYTAATAELALAFGQQVAIAIENAQLYQEAERLAVTNGLTGLYNRRHFYEMLEREVEVVKRYDGHISLIMLDIDNFKAYNDTYGHLVGDALLRELAQLLARDIRKADLAARYGGDEFVILLSHTGKKGAVVLAERIRTSVEEYEFWGEEGLPTGEASPSRLSRTVTVSVGVATCPEDAVEPEVLVNAADMALLEAKKRGNRVCPCGETA